MALLALVLSGCAGTRVRAPGEAVDGADARMSVARLLVHAAGQPVTPLPSTMGESMRRSLADDQVRMFLAGVIDSGEGRQWCVADSGRSRIDVGRQLIERLAQDHPPRMPAAAALAVELRRGYPCNGPMASKESVSER